MTCNTVAPWHQERARRHGGARHYMSPAGRPASKLGSPPPLAALVLIAFLATKLLAWPPLWARKRSFLCSGHASFFAKQLSFWPKVWPGAECALRRGPKQGRRASSEAHRSSSEPHSRRPKSGRAGEIFKSPTDNPCLIGPLWAQRAAADDEKSRRRRAGTWRERERESARAPFRPYGWWATLRPLAPAGRPTQKLA